MLAIVIFFVSLTVSVRRKMLRFNHLMYGRVNFCILTITGTNRKATSNGYNE